MDSSSVDFDTIQSNIKQILLQNGWDQSLLVETLESRYKALHQRDLSTDCWQFRCSSVDEFLVRSEFFRLFLKSGKTHVYLHPDKLEQPLPPTVPAASTAKRFKRKKKRQRRGEVTVIKFKANPWGSFEPIYETKTHAEESQELLPRPPAFDLYSDHESEDTDDCELVPVVQNEPLPPMAVLPTNDYPTTIPSFNVHYPVQAMPASVKRPFMSSQQIDGPTAQDFQEDEPEHPPAIVFGLQDLSLYALRQEECNRFSYNDLPSFRQCINYNAPRF